MLGLYATSAQCHIGVCSVDPDRCKDSTLCRINRRRCAQYKSHADKWLLADSGTDLSSYGLRLGSTNGASALPAMPATRPLTRGTVALRLCRLLSMRYLRRRLDSFQRFGHVRPATPRFRHTRLVTRSTNPGHTTT